MSWKDPPSDITIELSPGSPLSEIQLEIYRHIRNLLDKPKYRDKASLRVYVLGYEKPPKVPRARNKA